MLLLFPQLHIECFTAEKTLSDCNETRTHNHLVRKRTFNHLAKLAKTLFYIMANLLIYFYS